MKKDMSKCDSCQHKDKEKSNKNWTVCPCMPVEVVVDGNSENCENYVAEKSA